MLNHHEPLEISRYATEISNSAGCAIALFGFIPH
jgi:hypothetical protein